jgi:hypothetical protein
MLHAQRAAERARPGRPRYKITYSDFEQQSDTIMKFRIMHQRDYDKAQSLFCLHSSMSFGNLLKRIDFIDDGF